MIRPQSERPIVMLESFVIPPEFRLHDSEEIKCLNRVLSPREDDRTPTLGFGIVSTVVGLEGLLQTFG